MDIDGANYIQITLYNNSEVNEIGNFNSLISKCCIEANKPGLKNMFDKDERDLINAIMERLNLTAEKKIVDIKAGDTHTEER